MVVFDAPPSPSESLSVKIEIESSSDGHGSGFVDFVVDGGIESSRQGRERVLLRGQPNVDPGDVFASAQRVLTPKDRHQHPNELRHHVKQDAVSVLSQV